MSTFFSKNHKTFSIPPIIIKNFSKDNKGSEEHLNTFLHTFPTFGLLFQAFKEFLGQNRGTRISPKMTVKKLLSHQNLMFPEVFKLVMGL